MIGRILLGVTTAMVVPASLVLVSCGETPAPAPAPAAIQVDPADPTMASPVAPASMPVPEPVSKQGTLPAETVTPALAADAPQLEQPAVEAKPTTAHYVCPRHPQVISDIPGKCPECGLKLMKRAADAPPPTPSTEVPPPRP